MAELAPAAGYAVLVWWFTTGVILLLDGLPRRTFRWSMLAGSAVMLAALHTLHGSASDLTPAGAYTAFTCAILVWGWLEMSFLMGYVTGPRKHGCHEGCGGWQHFGHASSAIIYHEVAALGAAGLVAAVTWATPNQVGLWTFLVLWAMRLSAKLNLFLGVPNLGEKFLPAHLQYLKGFFKKRPMNFLFPLSVTTSTLVTAWLVRRCLASTDPRLIAAYALVSSLLALAVLEHWFMVLPFSSEKLWSWGFRPSRMRSPMETHISVKAPSEC